MTDFTLKLAPFHLLDPKPKVPNRRRVIAEFVNSNGVKITMSENHNHTLYWVSASKEKMYMARTATTKSKDVAKMWLDAVQNARVEVMSDDDKKTQRALDRRRNRENAKSAERYSRSRYQWHLS